MTAWVRTRSTRGAGVRFQVLYRTGGGDTPIRSAGTFGSAAEAGTVRDRVGLKLAACVQPARPRAEEPLAYIAELGGLLKIGHSIDPLRRCRELNATLLHTEPGGRVREEELHQQFAHLRERGEFFRPGRFGEIRRYVGRMQGLPGAVKPEAASPTGRAEA